MRFLVDEDLPRLTDSLLRSYGHDATDVRDVGLRGASDANIGAYARRQGLCLVSGDIGFADIRTFPPAQYCGIIVLRLPARATSLTIRTFLEGLLAQTEIVNQLGGKLAIVEPGRVRIRRG
ncbi:MAG: DUF5615 family PIN-like protein [Chloroflexi bacterium]|nr:DUF5615 family PIN-like protein [Chloroflexota bacterium]